MHNPKSVRLIIAGLILSGAFTFAGADEKPIVVNEKMGSLQVVASAPIPEEVTNEVQAQALSRDAAIVRGQTALLTYVLKKKTRSGKLLSEAEVPSIELQQDIRGTIKGARIVKTRWADKTCFVTLVLDKSHLKSILKKN